MKKNRQYVLGKSKDCPTKRRLARRCSQVKIVLVLIFSLYAVCCILSTAFPFYGRFYDGTGARDSVWMNVATFDTLGYQINADSVWFWRFFRTTLVDSTILTGAGTRTAYYVTGRRAFDGTNYGEYNVKITWKVQGKYFTKPESYTVFPDSVLAVGRLSTNNDKTSYQLASGQVIARADSVTGAGRLSTNLDKSNYQLAPGQVVARADSVTGAGRLSTNLDKINYRLSPQGRTDIWIEDTTGENSGWAQFFKSRLDVNISTRSTFNVSSESVTVDKSNLGAVQANLIPEDSNLLAGIKAKTDKLLFDAQDSLIIDYGRIPTGGGSATNPDTIANHVWIWGTRTLTSGSGAGVNQVIINTFQLPDSIPIIGTQVQVLNQNQSATTGLLNSNSTGQATFALDNGIYKLRMYKSGWVFTVPESIIVSGNLADTFYANAFNPGNPPVANLCRVYGWIRDLKGQPVASVTVEAKISTTPLRYQTVLISPYYKTTSTDSDGYWYLDLYPNSILTPSNTQYDFTIYIPYGTILKLKTSVPEQSSWQLQ
ncbi:MAG: hypothetical protein Q8O10_07045 [candidate division Zixibacteria bacterium]|nr:hypothetical protein [candidate division Zixibacteria bacterium]